ncbi:MAG: L,D-transpeptidase [Acidimicrobiia bacterium]|nr:L,D-transpeptidase [Acidimicrobiia bacterium]
MITRISSGGGYRYCHSGGCEQAVTPTGRFAFYTRYRGWQHGYLGALYNPVYFNGGIAVHGATSVPLRPASHGCTRITMDVARYFPDLVENGNPVYVLA